VDMARTKDGAPSAVMIRLGPCEMCRTVTNLWFEGYFVHNIRVRIRDRHTTGSCIELAGVVRSECCGKVIAPAPAEPPAYASPDSNDKPKAAVEDGW
jgi:hypothetical protein